jgi:hypothetical protein
MVISMFLYFPRTENSTFGAQGLELAILHSKEMDFAGSASTEFHEIFNHC